MERFEQTVRRNDESMIAKDNLKYKLYLAFAVGFSLLSVFLLVTSIITMKLITIVPLLLSGALTVYFYIGRNNAILEYDYCVEDDKLTVAKIKNLSARKELFTVPVRSFKRIEVYTPEKFRQIDAKKYIASLNEVENREILFFDIGNERCVLLFEPSAELLNAIKKELMK